MTPSALHTTLTMTNADVQRYGKDMSVTNLDKEKQIATLSSGRTIQYDALISTMPLDITLTWLGKKQWAEGLTHSSSHIIGLGMRGECPHGLKCWLYFPEDDCPFYRTTVFSHYAKKNCPEDATKLKTVCMVRSSTCALAYSS